MSRPQSDATSVAPHSVGATPRFAALMLRHLDPATALAEILFGLIMTLTFTLGAGLMIQDEGREGARALLIAVIGCNVAWGIIDGALFLVGELFDRGRLRRLGRSIRGAPDRAAATALVATELEPWIGDVLDRQQSASLYASVADKIIASPTRITKLTKEDWLGAVASFWLVVIASIPAAIPFLLLDDARLALRVSNAVLLLLLFVTGYRWARHTLSKPWLVGGAFLVIGLLLVVTAIALGG